VWEASESTPPSGVSSSALRSTNLDSLATGVLAGLRTPCAALQRSARRGAARGAEGGKNARVFPLRPSPPPTAFPRPACSSRFYLPPNGKHDRCALEQSSPDRNVHERPRGAEPAADGARVAAAEAEDAVTVRPVGRGDATQQLFVQLLSDKARVPTKGSAKAAGWDLFAAKTMTVPARDKAVVPTDISIHVPAGTYGRVAPRSGLAVKHFVDVGAGVVDEDYRVCRAGRFSDCLEGVGFVCVKGTRGLREGGRPGSTEFPSTAPADRRCLTRDISAFLLQGPLGVVLFNFGADDFQSALLAFVSGGKQLWPRRPASRVAGLNLRFPIA
ncbi:MAG: hypothetical protein BJ554DRAFT_4660, partial [Olpidium bornovanus]